MSQKLQKLKDYLSTDVWRIQSSTLPKPRFFLIRCLRTVILAFRGFLWDRCSLKASALSFYTILSIVPLVAMGFGIAKGFGMEKVMEERIANALKEHKEIAERVVTFSRNLLDSAQGGVVAGIGVALLFWTVIRLLGNIEKALNDIWGVKKGRTIARKFADYISVVVICPILLAVSSTLTVVLNSQVTSVLETNTFLSFLGPVAFVALKIVPYVITCAVFTFVYAFMPNTNVKLRSAILGGVLAGVLLQVVQAAYIALQIGVTRANAVYGSFAALPLFFVWLQVSWLVVLLGAEFSFAHQNVDTYEFEPDCLNASAFHKRLVSLCVAHLLIVRFREGEPPLTAQEISHRLAAPIRLINEVLDDLTEARVLSMVAESNRRQAAYQPARSIVDLSVGQVIEALDHRGSENIPIAKSDALQKLLDCLNEF
ncbi:MAG: YihY/virulence factor BrkB family protein, partial [Planctomycetota bacterium]|nr:YihY/virulence factor BrkB family protein [Planctomycetota bacterium]